MSANMGIGGLEEGGDVVQCCTVAAIVDQRYNQPGHQPRALVRARALTGQ